MWTAGAPAYVCNLGRAFAETAGRNRDAPALRLPAGDVSYHELTRLSNQIARWLISRSVDTGCLIGLQNSKTLQGYAAMLACLKIGAAYTNVDVQNPVDRLHRVLSICRPKCILCDGPPVPPLVEAACRNDIPLFWLSDWEAEINSFEFSDLPDSRVTGADIAYVMFTSGSTGMPKGVAITHGSILNFIAWVRSVFGVGPGDVVANANPIFFDNSVFDFYGALFLGACLAPIGNGEPNAAGIVRQVDHARCTIWFSVPSLLIYLMTMKALRGDTFRSIRSIVFGGEGYPKSELAKLFDLYGHRCRLFNVYGPTECTCICSAYVISADDLRDGSGLLPPLGRIADNFSYVVLDGDTSVTGGEIGELCLMGPQLAAGYYNDPERTAAGFVQNPLARALPQRMYRTGDLVRDVDDILYFVGRKDNQIKHMGYRIELEEIEAAINRLNYVVQSAVVYKRVRESFGHIIGYVATGSLAITDDQLRHDLGALLPPYMMPNRFVICSELPKNPNGKVDRARLKEL